MKKLLKTILAIVAVVGIVSSLMPVSNTYAINVFAPCQGGVSSTVCTATNNDNASNMVKNVINTLLFVLGGVSAIMIVIGGIRFATSGGDSSGVMAGKNTVLYAVIGLLVAIMAYSIVNFVLGRF